MVKLQVIILDMPLVSPLMVQLLQLVPIKMMEMAVIEVMYGFIKTTAGLGQKSVVILMESLIQITQGYLQVSLLMVQ